MRRVVGYEPYEGDQPTEKLNALYDVLSLWIDFFQPSMRLVEKHRHGARVTKGYDQAKMPYQRVLQSREVSEARKEALKRVYAGLNPIQLYQALQLRLNDLWGLCQVPGGVNDPLR